MHYFLSPPLSLILAKLIVKSAMAARIGRLLFSKQLTIDIMNRWKTNSRVVCIQYSSPWSKRNFSKEQELVSLGTISKRWREGIGSGIGHPWLKVDGCSTRNKRKRIYIYIYRSCFSWEQLAKQLDNHFISGELIVQRVAFNVSLVTLSRCANAGTAFSAMNDRNQGRGRGH